MKMKKWLILPLVLVFMAGVATPVLAGGIGSDDTDLIGECTEISIPGVYEKAPIQSLLGDEVPSVYWQPWSYLDRDPEAVFIHRGVGTMNGANDYRDVSQDWVEYAQPGAVIACSRGTTTLVFKVTKHKVISEADQEAQIAQVRAKNIIAKVLGGKPQSLILTCEPFEGQQSDRLVIWLSLVSDPGG